jgi:uncharacterized membrane protein (DUF4010 family)
MELSETFQQLGISLGLGLLVGLQRERSASRLAGFRTFPLITVFGTISSVLSLTFGGWIVALGLAALAGIIVVGSLARQKIGETDPGLTTEAAMLVMFCVGAYLPVGHASVAVALSGTVAVLLHLKPQLHSLAAKIGDQDFKAIMQFVLITLVILPVLPNRTFGPYEVLNPHKIWLLVVLIVGISLAGYIAYKLFGERAGAVIGGILGGLISSTATTVSYSRRARQSPSTSGLAALVIALASTVVFARVLIIAGSVAPQNLRAIGPPLAAMLGVLVVFVIFMFLATKQNHTGMPDQGNPSELKSALIFAALFAVVWLAVAAAKENFGDRGLYVVGVLSGLTDMDAITLSTAQFVQDGKLSTETGWRLILVASMSNLVFKAGTVAIIGNRALLVRAGTFFGLAFVAGALILIFWPGQMAQN